MRSFNMNRKTLSIILCIVFICVLSLTVAYAALSVTLNIVGNAEVVASNWDIHFDNPVVRDGSVNNNVPVIAGNELTFSANLANPGDYYEFIVDVVNDGSIDAMIDSVIKTPELTSEQAKYIKFDVSYQNGESISTKQTLYSGTSTPLKVKVQFRTDLEISDLPTSDSYFNFKLTLVYVQSDGSGSSIKNNGVAVAYANGDINEIGTVVTIGTEQFYVIGTDGDNVKLLSKYNLYVGNKYDNTNGLVALENPTGIQNANAIAWFSGYSEDNPVIGSVEFSSSNYWDGECESYPAYIYDENSTLYTYLEKYESYLTDLGFSILSSRLISYDELRNFGCTISCSVTNYPFLYTTSYWTGSAKDLDEVYIVNANSGILNSSSINSGVMGVRPVIEISKSTIVENELINFTVDGTAYQAYDGMTWEEWVDSDFDSADDFGVESNYIGHLWNDTDEAWYENVYFSLENGMSDIVLKNDVIISGHTYYGA